MKHQTIEIETPGRAILDVTSRITAALAMLSVNPGVNPPAESPVLGGMCQVFIRHTSASLLISENADPDVLRDLETFLSDMVPDGDPRFVHTAEGPDDMPAHIRSALTQTSLSIPVIDGRLALGTWQGIFLWEHRYRPHRRELVVSFWG